MSGLQGARCWRRTVTIDSEVRTLDHLNDVRHSQPSVIPTSPSAIPAPPPSFLRRLRHSCAPSVIPAEAGIQAICAGQGHSQCSTAPNHPRGSGGPSAGWRLVARLGGRMDSCLRRNDGQGGCDGGGGGTTEGAEERRKGDGIRLVQRMPGSGRPAQMPPPAPSANRLHRVLQLAVDVGLLHHDLADVLRVHQRWIVAEHDQIGALADLNRADFVIAEHRGG